MRTAPTLSAAILAGIFAVAAPDASAGDVPAVVLIGDSIRLGYAPTVVDLLEGKATVVSRSEYSGDSAHVRAHLGEWLANMKPAVIHINVGLHDLRLDPEAGTHQVELDAYKENLEAIRKALEADTDARLIFATTTPVDDDRHRANTSFHRREADVEAYNRAALEVFGASRAFLIDDLHAEAVGLGSDRAIGRDGVHFTPEAYRSLGTKVASTIEAALGDPPATASANCRWVAQAPVLDGRLDDPAWEAAEPIERFSAFWKAAAIPASSETRARLVWDDEAIYFAATMSDAELRAFGTERNDKLWYGDVFELFFKPSADRPEYYEFQANPRSTILELAFPKRGFDFATLAAHAPMGTEAVAVVDGTLDQPGDADRAWSVEGKIPWSIFAPTGGRPEPGASWRFALCRYDYGPEGTTPLTLSSAPLRRPSFHRYEDYGTLNFVRQ